MADETPAENPESTTDGEDAAAPVDEDRLPDDHPLVVKYRKQKKALRELADKAAKYDQYEDAQKTELQRALERAEAAESRASQAETMSRRARIAAEKGVPVGMLTGDSEDEIGAAADALLAWHQERATTAAKPKPRPSQLRSGLSGDSPADGRERAATALRDFANTRYE